MWRSEGGPGEGAAEQSPLPAPSHRVCALLLGQDSPKVVKPAFSISSFLFFFFMDSQSTCSYVCVQGLGAGGGDLQSLPEGDSELSVEH